MQKRILPMLTVMAMLLTLAGAAVAQLPEHRTARGTLLSISDDEAVVRTLDGNEQLRVQITADTTLPPRDLQQGDLVIVDYNIGPDPEGTAQARVIRMDARNSGLDSETEPATSGEMNDGEMNETERPASDRPATETFESDTTETESDPMQTSDRNLDESFDENDSNLPETAGSLPMVALLGLIALGLGTLVRVLR